MPCSIGHRAVLRLAVVAGMLTAVCHTARGQVPLPPPPPPQQSPIPFIAPPRPPSVAPSLAPPPAGAYPNQAPNTPVPVRSVAVDGATLLTPPQIAAFTQGLIGPATPTSAIEQARLNILKRYRDDGYPLVTVSAALSANGALRFSVTEGRISDVKLEGDIGPAGSKVLAILDNLIKPGPTSTAALERWLLIAQDLPGVTLQTVLRPSETDPGSLVLVARVTRTAFSGFIVADNRAYQYTGPAEILATAGFNSLTSLGERTEISIYHSLFDSTQVFGQAAFETFIGNSGLKFRIYGGAGTTTPSGTLATVGYNSTTQLGGLQLSYPLLYSRQQKLNLLGLFDVFESTAYESSTGTAPQNHDGLRIFRLGGDYARLDQIFGPARAAENRISVKLSHGIQGLGSSTTGSTSLSRAGEVMDFTAMTAEISRNQALFRPWTDASVNLLLRAAGQYSRDILPPEEEYHLGGLEAVRGYYAGELTGDSALTTTLELQLNTGVQFDALGKLLHSDGTIGLQFYTYYDWGQTYQNQPLAPNQHVDSVGVGLRSTLTQKVEFDVEGVTRLNRQPAGTSTSIQALAAQALYWRLLVRF